MNRYVVAGRIKYELNKSGDHYLLLLIQKDGFPIDLINSFSALSTLNDNPDMSVSYHLSDEEITEQEAIKKLIEKLYGKVEAEYTSENYQYSSWTKGTNYYNTLIIGGHSLYNELYDKEGKYIILIIEIK